MIERKFQLKEDLKIRIPGDKSLSHRAIIFSSLSRGESILEGFLEGEDPLHTMGAFRSLGVEFVKEGKGKYRVKSGGVESWKSSLTPLDFGNAGTGIRLSLGVLAGCPGLNATLMGDESLSKRPMKRVIDPLLKMGADVKGTNQGTAPLQVVGKKLNSIQYQSSLASAQVKSCLMFAAMSSGVSLEYEEPEISRTHTENMFQYLGNKLNYIHEKKFIMNPPYHFPPSVYQIPGDISSASFFIVLALVSKVGSIFIQNVGLNPSRLGVIEVLRSWGGKIEILHPRKECGEEVGDLLVQSSNLIFSPISEEKIPSIIDEIPILTIAGLFSKGGFRIRKAEDLRAKESDRIHSMVANLRNLGFFVHEYSDGYEVEESHHFFPQPIQTFLDHRIAMSFSILSIASDIHLPLDGSEWVETSFPGFFQLLEDTK
jgi:3-phosphoshikimate 1-carboxyvinyltransferase